MIPEVWKQYVIEVLEGVDCEVMACEVVHDDSTVNKNHAPLWHFMIYVRAPSVRLEVCSVSFCGERFCRGDAEAWIF